MRGLLARLKYVLTGNAFPRQKQFEGRIAHLESEITYFCKWARVNVRGDSRALIHVGYMKEKLKRLEKTVEVKL